MIDELKSAGLTDAESRVYLALIALGSTTAGPIVKKAQMHRATVYDALKRLSGKGLASSVLQGKTRLFQAAQPSELVNWQKEKLQTLQEIIPALTKQHTDGVQKQEVRVYQGKKGIRCAMDNILDELNPHGEYLDFGVSGKFKKVMGPYWNLWQKIKKERRIKSKCIFSAKLKNRKLIDDYHGEYRFHPTEYESPTDTMIYNDSIAMFIWTGSPPIAIVIKNKENAEGYRRQFQMMWKNCADSKD